LEKLLQTLRTIREKLRVYGDWLTRINPKIPNSFNMIFNDTTLTLELLHYYFQLWKSPPPPLLSVDEIKRIKEENAQRVLEITKWAFISTLSNVEYSAKETLKTVSEKSFKQLREMLRGSKRVYLRAIMKKSREIGLIDEKQYKTWQGLIEVRNAIVHNNAIADIDAKYEINDMEVIFIKGKMLRGKLNFFIKLLEAAINQYHQWLKTLLSVR